MGFSPIYSQTDEQIDSLTVEMCKTLAVNENLVDSVRVLSTFEKHLPGFLQKHHIRDDAQFDALYNKIFFRYQKNCNLLTQILAKGIETKGEWKFIIAKPKITVTKKQCRDLETIKNFYYLESDGTKTNVTIADGYWTEQFADGSYSKLYFRWTGDVEFEIEFIESNNHSRQNFSNKGDIYHYGIFGRKGNDFQAWVNDIYGKPTESFWLHAKK